MPTGTLPNSAKKIWESVYKDAKASGDSEAAAAQKAWGAVKKNWIKKNGKWVKKSNLVETFSMHINKATFDGKIMKWAAVNSDTDPDSHEERMSVELYQDFISRINSRDGVPEEFRSVVCSKYWCGGMPYLSISHYPDLNGKAVPGETIELYIDGDNRKARLKAKGTLFDTPLGHATYRSLQEDKNKKPEDKIRISIGFLDLGHKHGEDGDLWIRESLTSICPQCFDGVGDKIYVKGCLVHLAMTRVPVNKRTEMVLEEKSEMAKKIPTRKEDAASIVGEVEAENIDAINKAATTKSDALVEMAEGETSEETQELINEAETEVATENQETEDSVVAAAETNVEKSEPETEKMMDSSMLPYDGATSMGDAQKSKKAMEEMQHALGLFSMFQNVVWNIVDRSDVTDKKGAISKAVDEFKSMLAAKAMVEFSQAQPERAEVVAKPNHSLQPALDSLLGTIDNSLTFDGDLNSRLELINPSLQELGDAITDYVKTKSAANEPAPDVNNNNLREIKELLQSFESKIGTLQTEIGILKSQGIVQTVETKNRIPQPRTNRIVPTPPKNSAETAPKTGNLRAIMNKSVGLPENS